MRIIAWVLATICALASLLAIFFFLVRPAVETIRVADFARGDWALGDVKTCKRGANNDGTDALLSCDWILVDAEKARVTETLNEGKEAYQLRSSPSMSRTLGQLDFSKSEMARFSEKLDESKLYHVEYSTMKPKYEAWLCKKTGDHQLACRD